MAGFLWRRRWWVVGAAAMVVAFVVVWFEPQALLLDQVVDEALPTTAASPAADAAMSEDTSPNADPTSTPTAAATPTAPNTPSTVDIAEGAFGSLGRYTTTGRVRVVELADDRRFVRLEDFATDNGPDLLVYLSTAPADGSGDFAAEFVDLGTLRGNIGDQNYELPPDVELSEYASVVIWCRRFTTAFGAAALGPVA